MNGVLKHQLWRASIRHLRTDRELLLVPPLHALAFLLVYLGPVGIALAALQITQAPDALALAVVLGAVATGMWLAILSMNATKVLVAASCRQRWAGESPDLGSAWHETWALRKQWSAWSTPSRPSDMRVVSKVFGTAPITAHTGPGMLFWILAWIASCLVLGLLAGLVGLTAMALPSEARLGFYVAGIFAAIGGVFYVQGLAGVVAAIGTAAEHQHEVAGAPAGFEFLDEP